MKQSTSPYDEREDSEIDFSVKINRITRNLSCNISPMAGMASTTFTTDLDTSVKDELEQIARYDNQSASSLARGVITALVEERRATRELVKVGLQLVETGVSISEEKMDAWFDAPENAPFPEPDTFQK